MIVCLPDCPSGSTDRSRLTAVASGRLGDWQAAVVRSLQHHSVYNVAADTGRLKSHDCSFHRIVEVLALVPLPGPIIWCVSLLRLAGFACDIGRWRQQRCTMALPELRIDVVRVKLSTHPV